MDCFMCSTADGNMQKLQTDMDIDILKKIAFVLPDLVIPDTQAVYACATCLEQVACFYEIKITCLGSYSDMNLCKDILKGSSDGKFNVLKIVINNSYKISAKSDLNCEDLLLLEDVTRKDSDLLKCRDSTKTFTKKKYLKIHNRDHTGERPYKCPICHKTFTQSGHLNRHILLHTGKKPHECLVCHKTFTQKNNLMSHKRIHTNVRPYQCTVCDKAFIQSGNLSRHKRIHTGEKPHQCQLCQYKCTQANDLKTHMRTHTGKKPFTCKFCQTSFAQSSTLKMHERRIHNNVDFN